MVPIHTRALGLLSWSLDRQPGTAAFIVMLGRASLCLQNRKITAEKQIPVLFLGRYYGVLSLSDSLTKMEGHEDMQDPSLAWVSDTEYHSPVIVAMPWGPEILVWAICLK